MIARTGRRGPDAPGAGAWPGSRGGTPAGPCWPAAPTPTTVIATPMARPAALVSSRASVAAAPSAGPAAGEWHASAAEAGRTARPSRWRGPLAAIAGCCAGAPEGGPDGPSTTAARHPCNDGDPRPQRGRGQLGLTEDGMRDAAKRGAMTRPGPRPAAVARHGEGQVLDQQDPNHLPRGHADGFERADLAHLGRHASGHEDGGGGYGEGARRSPAPNSVAAVMSMSECESARRCRHVSMKAPVEEAVIPVEGQVGGDERRRLGRVVEPELHIEALLGDAEGAEGLRRRGRDPDLRRLAQGEATAADGHGAPPTRNARPWTVMVSPGRGRVWTPARPRAPRRRRRRASGRR